MARGPIVLSHVTHQVMIAITAEWETNEPNGISSSKFNGSRACREFLTRGSELVPSCSTRITRSRKRRMTTTRALFAVRSPFCPITRSSPRFSGVWLDFGGVTSESIGIIDRYLSRRMEYRVIGGAVRYRSACTFLTSF